jgi:hypothetical protein
MHCALSPTNPGTPVALTDCYTLSFVFGFGATNAGCVSGFSTKNSLLLPRRATATKILRFSNFSRLRGSKQKRTISSIVSELTEFGLQLQGVLERRVMQSGLLFTAQKT